MANKKKFTATNKEFKLFASEGWSIFTEDGTTMQVMRIDDPEEFANGRNIPVPPELKDDNEAIKKARKHLKIRVNKDGQAIILGRKG